MRTVFPDNEYSLSLAIAGVETLASRREQLTERFYITGEAYSINQFIKAKGPFSH